MAGIFLLDRNDVEHAGGPRLVAPDAPHARQARPFDLVPDHAGLGDALAEAEVRWRLHRRGDSHDRVAAMIDPPHPHDGLLAGGTGVVSGDRKSTRLNSSH